MQDQTETLVLTLPADVAFGLRQAAERMGKDVDTAAVTVLREMLIGLGFIEWVELDEESGVDGTA